MNGLRAIQWVSLAEAAAGNANAWRCEEFVRACRCDYQRAVLAIDRTGRLNRADHVF